jgi:hypothetical protein
MNNVIVLLVRLRWCAEHSSRRVHVHPPGLAVVHRAVANLLSLSSLRVIVSIHICVRPAQVVQLVVEDIGADCAASGP